MRSTNVTIERSLDYKQPANSTDPNAKTPAIIFVHLPKCGGTTLNRLIEWEYSPTQVLSIDPSFFRWSYRKVISLPRRRLARMRAFQGHMPFGLHKILPQKATYLTVLREPVDRGISEYYYALSRVVHPEHRTIRRLSLDKYIQLTPYANVQTKLLAGQDSGYDFLSGDCNDTTLELAKQNLSEHFSLVGLTERFEETLALAKLLFGWKIRHYSSFNVTRGRPTKDEVPAEIRNVIEERYRYDVELYRFAAALFQRSVASYGERVRKDADELKNLKRLPAGRLYYFRGASAIRKVVSRLHSYV
jgi:Galactose-3-O-sulfotransferase